MKVKKWLKRIGIGCLVIIAIFVAIIIFLVVNDLKSEKKLNQEIEEIQNILNATDFDEQAYKEKLNKTVTTGDYYKVERAYKNYLRDCLKISKSIVSFYEQLEIENLLTMENLKTDGKEFFTTRSILNSYSDQLDNLKLKFDSMADEKKAMSYLKEDIGDYYVKYYKEIIGDVKHTEETKELSKYLEDSSTLIKSTKKAFDFLSEQKEHWVIEDEMVLFDSQELLSQYQSIISEIIDFANNTVKNSNEDLSEEAENNV